MAYMIPETYRENDPRSREREMYEALEQLPDDYYVFHSFTTFTGEGSKIEQHEADFVIYNRNKGILVIEAKAGHVRHSKEEGWLYSNGVPMKHGGPLEQASDGSRRLRNCVDYVDPRIRKKCKFMYAVWFPSMKQSDIGNFDLPQSIRKELILPEEALDGLNVQRYIDKIFSMPLGINVETNLSDYDDAVILKKVLMPELDIVETTCFEVNQKKRHFAKLLREQTIVLNFLQEQKTVAVNGVAGTGKTLIAMELARRHVEEGEKVLFLCFNAYLASELNKKNNNPDLTIMTIDGYACKECRTASADYKKLSIILDEYDTNENYPYDLVVIDEGQDFGQKDIENNNILTLLKCLMESKENGRFYVFYDKHQFVQGNGIPEYIREADCKISLYKNCRNTFNIANTSVKVTDIKTLQMKEDNSDKGNEPVLYYCDDDEAVIKAVDTAISNYQAVGISDIVILTNKTEEASVLASKVQNSRYKGVKFTTCRKFKGLEADAVIMVDLDSDSFDGANANLFYVGTSRARIELSLVAKISDSECTELVKEQTGAKVVRNGKRQFALWLHVKNK